ncbi:hypothetical protein O181_034220 [Austropuccinia psidii MF-1]|uniref:Integrase catalytic domain-containing protein n=1 Tax=Austropuccinia psidii MF-1 TaxID=1389203 RepID=A0A9Q3D2N7_9BASI|nr:hypothetical protein [Austropuccinia psidii MF-1]
MKFQVPTIYSIAINNPDWNITLGHPNDNYIREMMKLGLIAGNFTKSSHCDVCKQAKIKNCPHSRQLPQTTSPFFKLHLDTLQLLQASQNGHCYILVIVDDFTRFNRIYCITNKNQAEECIESYLNELSNKLNISPALLHTDRGGEFSSKKFVNKMKGRGICFQQGPPNSPQTNGVAESFNQSLLSKMCCLIGQSNIPTYLWNEAASHSSFLLNQLPHKFLNFKSLMDKLDEFNCRIEPKINLKNILPFGIKVVIKSNTANKIDMPGKIMRALTFKKYSDALRVLNIKTGLFLKLPHQDDSQKQVLPPQKNEIETQNSTTSLLSSDLNKNPSNEHYQYVPFYEQPPNHISSTISSDNIIEGRRNRNMPD